MQTNKQIIKEFQSMKPSLAMKKIDISKFPKEVREKIKASLSEISDDTLDLQQDQSTFKKWIEMMADLYPAAFGLKVEKVPSLAPSVTPASTEQKKDVASELEAKIKDLETRSGIIKKMILKQPAKRDELRVRLKTVDKMIKKLGDELKEAKKSQKKSSIKKSLGGFLLGAIGGIVAGQFVDLKLKKKSFKYGEGGTIEGNKMFKYSITYALVTPESAEHGDYEKQGYEIKDEQAELQDILRKAVNDYGIYSPTGTIHAGISFESVTPDHDHDYFTKGHERYYTLHITHVDGSDLTLEETQFIANKISEGRKLHWDEEDKEWWRDGGKIHSSDEDGILMFKADTKGGKYSIEVREHTNQLGTSYRVVDFTNGQSRGYGSYNNKEIAIHKIMDSIIGSKKIDGINYIISLDNLYIGENLPLAEKMWEIYNGSEYREWFKKEIESLSEEQKKAVSEELKNKAIKYVKDNGYREDDSTIGNFFQIFKREKLVADFLKSKKEPELKKNGGDLLPPITKYSEYLQSASSKFGITIDEARNKYGQYTISQWENLLSGGVDDKKVDLFEYPDLIPSEVQEILDKYWKEFGDRRDYKDTQRMLEEVQAVGYTFDYYLDNEPYGLRKIGVELNELEGYEKMKKGGKIQNNYKGKTPEEIWNSWSKNQKAHFISDHSVLKPFMKEENDVINKKWKDLPDEVEGVHLKGVISTHLMQGQYSNGGGINSDTPKVYIADLAAYNEGKLIGEWIDLSDFSSGEDVMEKISELIKKWSKEQGEEREEFAVHDMENFPKDLYGEYMGKDDFQKVIDYWEAVSNSDYPKEVVEEWMALTNEDDFSGAVSNMDSAYHGKYKDAEDFAYQFVEDVGMPSNPEQYLYVSDTDKRIVANEQADFEVDEMSDDDILERADMKDEYDEAENNEDSDEIERILKEAKEKVHDEIYEEWHDGLDDPYQFLVKEHGLYDEASLIKQTFVGFDYAKFAEDLEQDYYIIEHDGEVYVFNQNYKKGGSLIKSRKLARN